MIPSVKVVCRDEQLEEIRLYLGIIDNNRIPVQSLFVYGGAGVGKSFCVKQVLDTAEGIRYLWLNSLEILQPRCAFSSILNQLKFPHKLKSLEDFSELISCDTASDFIRLFVQCLDPEDRLYIVFDNAHRLREMDMMPFFLRLQELSNRRVCCVFISNVMFNHLLSQSDFLCSQEVYFPNYNQEELGKVLVENRPVSSHSSEFYATYIRLVMSMFKNVTNNVKELNHIATVNFHHYISPIKEDPEAEFDSIKLWKNIEPHLKKAMNTIYLRDADANVETNEVAKSSVVKQIIELPFYSKYLLIAAYLASYNPASTDKKYFVKRSNRERRKQNTHRRAKPNYHLLGPRPFPFNRLLAIFHAIIDVSVEPNSVLLNQISSLVHHRLVTQIASKDLLNTPRYKCCVDFDYITTIAKTVKFPVVEYLEDFNM